MILRADNLIKTYKGRSVVKGISVEVNQGELWGCWDLMVRKNYIFLYDRWIGKTKQRQNIP